MYNVKQLAEATNLQPDTIRKHARERRLIALPKEVGVRGLRFTRANAVKWASKYFPEAKLPN